MWANSVAATCSTVWVHDEGYIVSSHGTVVDWTRSTSATELEPSPRRSSLSTCADAGPDADAASRLADADSYADRRPGP